MRDPQTPGTGTGIPSPTAGRGDARPGPVPSRPVPSRPPLPLRRSMVPEPRAAPAAPGGAGGRVSPVAAARRGRVLASERPMAWPAPPSVHGSAEHRHRPARHRKTFGRCPRRQHGGKVCPVAPPPRASPPGAAPHRALSTHPRQRQHPEIPPGDGWGVQSGPPPPARYLPVGVLGLGDFGLGKDPELIPPPKCTPSERAQVPLTTSLPASTALSLLPPPPQTPSYLLPPGVPHLPSLCLAAVLMPPSPSLPNKDLRGHRGLGDVWGVRGSVPRVESAWQQGQ